MNRWVHAGILLWWSLFHDLWYRLGYHRWAPASPVSHLVTHYTVKYVSSSSIRSKRWLQDTLKVVTDCHTAFDVCWRCSASHTNPARWQRHRLIRSAILDVASRETNLREEVFVIFSDCTCEPDIQCLNALLLDHRSSAILCMVISVPVRIEATTMSQYELWSLML